MSRYTKNDIFRMVEEEDVEFIRLQFTDIFGVLKNIAITSSQLERALNNQCMFDGSAVEGFVRIEESDMYLYPDYDTFEIFPWRPQQGKVARLICDVYTVDGKPFQGDPRNVLKRAIQEAADMGYVFDVGPECEFFLFHTDDNGLPTTLTHEKGGYFDLGPIDLGENVRRDMILTLEDMGFEIEASHHEVAPAQHEIDFRYDEALITADNIMTFKLTVKTIAKRHGLYATFMPKPKYGINGSGMHVNMSLATLDGRNIFTDENDERGLSEDAYHFIAGLMTDEVKNMTHQEDIAMIEDTKAWLQSPERKAPKKERDYAVARLDGVIGKIRKAMQSTLEKMKAALLHADKKKAVTEEIKKQTKPSIVEALRRGMEEQRKKDSEKQAQEKQKKQDMEL